MADPTSMSNSKDQCQTLINSLNGGQSNDSIDSIFSNTALKQIKEEEKLERERNKDIKLFLRKEQALLRKEQAERQKRFLQEIKLERQIEKFRIREIKELEQLEKISLKEKREDYASLQERIDNLKQKYQIIRDQKIKERVEALGVKLQGNEDRETLLIKEKEYTLARTKS